MILASSSTVALQAVAEAYIAVLAAAARAAGLRSRAGRFVLELLPPGDRSKGTAIEMLLKQSELQRVTHALYVGDDATYVHGQWCDSDARSNRSPVFPSESSRHAVTTPVFSVAQAETLMHGRRFRHRRSQASSRLSALSPTDPRFPSTFGK